MSSPNIKPHLPSGKSIKRYGKQGMTKPMTVEELKEKARLTDEEIEAIDETIHQEGKYYEIKDDSEASLFHLGYFIKAQQDKDWQTFIQFCDENDAYIVVTTKLKDGKLLGDIIPVSEVLG